MRVKYLGAGRRAKGGWFLESDRHRLSAKGIKTGTKRVSIDPLKLGYRERTVYRRNPETGEVEPSTKRFPTKEQRKYDRLVRKGFEFKDFSGRRMVFEGEGRRQYTAAIVSDAEQRLAALDMYMLPPQQFDQRQAFDAYALPPEEFDKTPYGVQPLPAPTSQEVVDLYAMPVEQFDQRVPVGRFYAQKNQAPPGVLGKVGDTKIIAEKIEPGYAFPIAPKDVEKQLQKTPEDDRKGLKAVKFVQPKNKMQKGAWAQLVRSKKEMLIFAQPESELKDVEKVRKHMKQYVLPHEIGHHVALNRRGITDRKLSTAEARADGYAFGFDVKDKDIKTFEKFHE